MSGDPLTPLFPFGWGMSYTNFSVSGAALTPGGDGAVVGADAELTVSGTLASAGPAGKMSLLLYYSQNAPTKWARFGTQLFAFGKFDVPANSKGTPFSFSARVRDMDAYDPDTADYEVFSGAYTVTLGTCATCPALAKWTVNVNGTYTWAWDYTV
jgi:beta-glucosidase